MSVRVLILDDESSVLEVLKACLDAQHYECQTTESPFEALGWLERQPFDVLITDVRMPEMNGIDVVRRAKELDENLAIIIVTAIMDVNNAVQAVRVGADDYVLKPFNMSEISISVTRAVEKRALILDAQRYQQELESRVQIATEDLERLNRELYDTKEYLENLLHSTVDAIVTIDNDGKIEFANRGALRMLGYSEAEFQGRAAATLFAGGAEELRVLRGRITYDTPLQNYETELIRRDGQKAPVSMSVSLVKGSNRRRPALLAICKDITEQRRLQHELHELSIRDNLTGLYNQRYFYDRLKAEIERARRQKHPLSLLLFDIDRFKQYNDAHGHLDGDKVLQAVGQVVFDCTRDHVDTGFRYGGDEFVVILPEADERQALQIAERIRQSFEAKRFDELTLSMGLMSYRDGYSLPTFIQFADAMMYDAKRSGGNNVFVYNPEKHKPIEEAKK